MKMTNWLQGRLPCIFCALFRHQLLTYALIGIEKQTFEELYTCGQCQQEINPIQSQRRLALLS